MKVKILFFFVTFHILSLLGTPTVSVRLLGLLGNRFWGFCIGKIVAEELGYNLYCKPIIGFPNTYIYNGNKPSNKYPTDVHNCEQEIDLKSIITNKKQRNIKLQGYFQRLRYIAPYVDKIRNEWLVMDPALKYEVNSNDVVIHIRFKYPYPLPFSYYEKALSSITYDQVYICTNEPNHPSLKLFDKYKPIIRSTSSLSVMMNNKVSWDEISKLNLDDFTFINSCNKIIISTSTYSWWAAFLSDASEIYAPWPTKGFPLFGSKVNEPRYHYIETQLTGNDILF